MRLSLEVHASQRPGTLVERRVALAHASVEPQFGEHLGVERPREPSAIVAQRLELDDVGAFQGRCNQLHDSSASSGVRTAKVPPQSRMNASCSTISSLRFQGRTKTTSGRSSRDHLWCANRDVGARKQVALLVRVQVDGVVKEVRSNAAVVQQRVALGRRAVPDDPLAVALELDQRLEDPSFVLRDPFAVVGVGVDARVARRRPRGRAVPERGPSAASPRRRRGSRRCGASPPWVGSSSTSNRRSPCAAKMRLAVVNDR